MLKQTKETRLRRALHGLLIGMILLFALTPLAVQAGSPPDLQLPGDITRPFALFSVSCNGLTCTFNGSASVDPDGGAIISYRWNFGNGATLNGGAIVNYTYAAPGTYNVTLTVTDDEWEVGSRTQPVTVGGLPRIRVMQGSIQIQPDGVFEFGGTRINRPLNREFNVCNDGTAPLTVTNLHVSRDSGFYLLYPRTGFTVQPGACGVIGIQLIASDPNLYAAYLSITSNAQPTKFKFRMNGAVTF